MINCMKRLVFFLPALLAAGSAFADEGLWLFNMPPARILESKYNFTPSREWLDHLRLSSVKFSGGSGSFVSPQGLVLTNHHVGQGAIQQLSTKDRDLMKTGFHAATAAEELKVPGMELSVLQGIEDVTARIKGAEQPGMTAAEAAEARQKEIAAVESEETGKTGFRCSVVTLFSGELFHLYRYKIFTDVRLVFAPDYLTAFFGGDKDNFTYPRYDLDFSIFRIYENDRPYASPHYLKWSTDRIKEGDLMLVSGHPGSTGRLLTTAQMEFLRDVSYPWTLENYKRRIGLLKEFSKRGAEAARFAQGTIFGLENSVKAIGGYHSGLLDKALMDIKTGEEAALRAAIAKDAELEKQYGRAWEEIAAAQKAYASLFKPYRYFEGGAGFATSYFNTARTLVRLAAEKTRPDAERLREYRDAALPSLIRRLEAERPILNELEIFNLTDSLIQIQKEFGTMTEVKWLFAGRLAEDVARELVLGTKLGDPAVRKSYIDGGLQAVYLSDDPMIKAALLFDPVSRGYRKRYEDEVESVEAKNGALIAQAMFKIKGSSIPPDATGTLRLSFGPAKGYVENGRKIPYYTDLKGLYALAEKNGYRNPYELPDTVRRAKTRVNLSTPVNIVAATDSIGGNSGSPVVNRKGEFSGVLFDGNIQSLPARFVYTDVQNRSVIVHAKAIIEALTNIYGAGPLAKEILGK